MLTLPEVGTIVQKGKRYEIEYDFDLRVQTHFAKLGVGTRIRHTIRKFYKKNTPKQRAYLFSVVIPLITVLRGYKRSERKNVRDHVYNILKREYLTSTDSHGYKYVVQLREDSNNPADVAMVAFFIEQIKDEAAMQHGFPIPDADKEYTKGEIEEIVTELERQ